MKNVYLLIFPLLLVLLNPHYADGQATLDSTTVGINGTSTTYAPCTEILRFDNYDDATAGSTSGQDFIFRLGNNGLLSFNLKRVGAVMEAVTAPCWSGAQFGQYDYSGLSGDVVLYQIPPSMNTTLLLDSILVKDRLGNIISNYTIIIFDGEATDVGEVNTLTVPNGYTWYSWDSMIPPAPYSNPIESGTGTNVVQWTGTAPQYVNNKSFSIAVDSAPQISISMVHTEFGYQAIAVGIKRTIAALNDTICGATGNVNINLLDAATGTTYTWPAPVINPPGSITGAAAQAAPATSIAQYLTNTTLGTATATYTITPISCFSIDSPFTVTVVMNPAPVVNLGGDSSVCSNNPITLNATTAGATYNWQDSSTLPTYTVTQSGTYYVTVTVAGCSVKDSAQVSLGSLPPVTITTNVDTICSNDSAQICAPAGYTTYNWNMGYTTRCVSAKYAGNYYVTVTDNSGCSAQSNHLGLTVLPLPIVSISQRGDTLSVYYSTNVQWYINNNLIPGATQNIYIAPIPGSYTVSVTDSDGCTSYSLPIIYTGIENIIDDENISIYPNPLQAGSWKLEVGSNLLGAQIEILDDNGRVVYKSEIRNLHSEIDAEFAGGVYLLRVATGAGVVVRRLVKL